MEKIGVGVDVGGSHVTCQLFNLNNNQPLPDTLCRLEINSRNSKEEILNKWISAIRYASKGFDLASLEGIGFAMPGPFDYSAGVAWFKGVRKYDTLYGTNIRREVKARLDLPLRFTVRFMNDAHCFAVGEALNGEATSFGKIIAITLGTGFGTAFIENCRPVKGVAGIPEEGFLYNIPFKDSIADDYFSTRWLTSEFNKHTGSKVQEVMEIFSAPGSQPVVSDIFRIFGSNLGRFLTTWVIKFKADCIILGGNLSKNFMLFKNEMETELRNEGIVPVVLLSEKEETSALLGSAKLCDDTFYNQLF